jgi:hypothetical protein
MQSGAVSFRSNSFAPSRGGRDRLPIFQRNQGKRSRLPDSFEKPNN